MLWSLSSMVFFLFHAPVYSNIITESKQQFGTQSKPTSYACYNRVEGSRGSIQKTVNPRLSDSVTCDWDIDVTKGFIIELHFEAFELPSSRIEQCSSYIEISYTSQQDEDIKRMFCPASSVDRIYTDSQTVHVKYVYRKNNLQDDVEQLYGFKINYKAVAVKGTNNAVTITVSCIGAASMITLCFYCIRSHIRSKRNFSNLSHDMLPQAPNAPSRAELQSAVDFYRNSTLAPQSDRKYLPFTIFQSRTSSLSAHSAVKKQPLQHPAAPPSAPVFQALRKISLQTTPRSVFPEARDVMGSTDSAHKIALQKLRTRLEARFSSTTSRNSSDVSVFFDASDRRSYSRLSCEDEKSPKLPSVKSNRASSNASADVPSIVIEFVE